MKNEHGGIIAWFIRNPVAANLLMLLILVSGLLSAIQIRKEFFPEFSTGTIRVTIPFPGAGPEDVEQGVIVKVEEALQGINGVKKITANAYEGVGTVGVTVEKGHAVDKVLDKVKSRIDGITTFPRESEKPVIVEESTRDGVLWLVLSGPLPEGDLKRLAREIKDDLTAHAKISQVEIHGTRENEIQIELSEAAMAKYGLTFDTVTAQIQAHSLDLAAGTLHSPGGDMLLRTNARAESAAQFRMIPLITDQRGTRITLGQVARVTDGFEEADWFLRYQGQSAVGLQIFRVGRQNALDVAAAAKAYLGEKQKELPPGVTLAPIADTSVMLKDRLRLMLKNLGWGGLLVLISLILFLRLKVAFWVMAGLPVCFLGTVWLMPAPFIDISINMITLFGFILVLGIVVDDAIVIGENIHSTVTRHGPGMNNVIRGARQVATAATFGVLTTMAAFLPMLMIPGINGKIWRGIALVVILSLVFSLIESKLILPAHLARMKHAPEPEGSRNPLLRLQRRVNAALIWFSRSIYQPLLEYCLGRWMTTLALFAAILILTLGMVHGGKVRFVFFPDIESDTIEANLKLAAGTPLDATGAVTAQIEAAAREVNEQFRQTTGRREDLIRHVISMTPSASKVWFYAELMPAEQRPMGSNEVIRRWREATGDIANAISLEFSGTAAESGRPISFELRGRDDDQLRRAALAIKRKLGTYAGVHDIQDSFESGKRELNLGLKPEASFFGLTTADLARQVRQGFHGSEAQTLQRGHDEVKIRVRYPRSQRQGMGALNTLRLRTSDGDEIPFHLVARATAARGYARIDRVDGRRVIHVSANVDKQAAEPQRIIDEMQSGFIPEMLKRFPGLRYDLSGEALEKKESLQELTQGVWLALVLIFAMMAIPLKSYVQPLAIMAAIPFGVVGAVWGHWLIGLPVSILSLCGIIALSGVVVNDSLIMVDVINQKRATGQPLIEAVKASGAARLRAILLTSLTTFIGLSPMLMERSLQAQFLIPMSASLAFGILFATAITLILIPVLYVAGIHVTDRLRGMIRRRTGRMEAALPVIGPADGKRV